MTAGKHPYLLLTLLCLLLFWPGQRGIPPIDRDEARFAEASRQMAQSGDFIDIHFQGEPRYRKPILLYWLQAAAVSALGEDRDNPIWPYRLPSLLGAIAAVLATCRLGRILGDARTGYLAALLLATSLLLNVEARLATTDALLLACSALGFCCLARLSNPPSFRPQGRNPSPAIAPADIVGDGPRAFARDDMIKFALSFWVLLALGLLLKGPVILLILGLPLLATGVKDRSWRLWQATRPELGVPLALLLVLPWLLLIGWASQGAFFGEALGQDFAAKLISSQERHGTPTGTYLLELPLSFWPGSLLVMLALPVAWRRRREPAIGFLLLLVAPSWLAFEIAPTKLPHYVLPLFPPLAVLTALCLRDRPLPLVRGLSFFYLAAAMILALALALIGPWQGNDMAWRSWPLTGLGALAAVLAMGLSLGLAIRPRHATTLLPLAAAVYALAFGAVLPGLQAPYLMRQFVEHRQGYAAELQAGPVALAGFHEPSAVLWLGPATRLVDPQQAAAELAGGQVTLALVAADEEPAFLAAGQFMAIDRISGVNYARGKRIMLTVYRRAD